MDNIKVNDVAQNYFIRRLKNWKNSNMMKGEFMHMHCCTNITNLIITDDLKLWIKSK